MIKHIVGKVEKAADAIDTITVDVPLLIRLLELAREDIKSDQELHDVTENIIRLSKENNTLTMEHYDAIVKSNSNEQE